MRELRRTNTINSRSRLVETDRGSYGNCNGEVVVSEVKKYLDAEMTYQARRRYGRDQNVWISGEMERVLVQLGSQQN